MINNIYLIYFFIHLSFFYFSVYISSFFLELPLIKIIKKNFFVFFSAFILNLSFSVLLLTNRNFSLDYQSLFFELIFILCMTIHYITDFIDRSLFLAVSILLFISGIIYGLIFNELLPFIFNLGETLILFFLFMLTVFVITKLFKINQGLGDGDIILLFALIPWINFFKLIFLIGLSSIIGIFIGLIYQWYYKKSLLIPFASIIFISFIIQLYLKFL